MNIQDFRREGKELTIGVILSFAIHGLLVVLILATYAYLQLVDAIQEEEEDEEVVEVILEEEPEEWEEQERELAALLQEWDRQESLLEESLDDDEIEEPEAEAPLVEEQEEEEDQVVSEEEPLDMNLEAYAVDQSTNEEEPDEALHISDQANRTEEETVADVRTLEEVEPFEEPHEAPESDQPVDHELAMSVPDEILDLPEEMETLEETLEPEQEATSDDVEEDLLAEEESEETQEELREYSDPSELVLREAGEVRSEELFDRDRLFARDQETRDRIARNVERRPVQAPEGRRILSRWEEDSEALRASLENYLPHVEVGNHTSVNAKAAPHASYLARMHRTIHQRWANGFIPRVQDRHSNAHPLNDMTLQTIVEIVIDAELGEVVSTNIVSGSGNTIYDAEAVLVSRSIRGLPAAPESIVSPDGMVYVHWTYWRDARQCGTFGARIYRLQEVGERRVLED